MESEDDDDEQDSGSGSPEEWSTIVRELQGKLQDLQTCSDLIAKHGNALQRALSELESNAEQNSDETKSKAVSERATLFRIASNAMINVRSLWFYWFIYMCMCVCVSVNFDNKRVR